MHDNLNTARQADVCLVLEGGYPHVTGGVSVWVQELTRRLPDVRFSIAHVHEDVGGRSARVAEARYAMAPNVVSLVDVPVEPSIDRLPAMVAERLPEASVYHACITGHASAAAGAAAARGDRSMILTEHGLAWREAPWMSGCLPLPHLGRPGTPSERAHRVARIGRQAREAYGQARFVTSVCAANVRAQRRLGAPIERSMLIPNAVACATRATPRETAGREPAALRVGFVGRVVPIKDVMLLLRAVALAAERTPVDLVVVGPLDHDPRYVERCRDLVRRLGLEETVRFIGEADPGEWYARLDVIALTSASEAQPLVLLEAMAAGVPVLATRVGGCPELLTGSVHSDRVGPAGLLVPAGDPVAAADALIRLAGDPALRARLGASGRARIRRHDPDRVWGAYRSLYERAAAAQPRQPCGHR